MPMFYKWGGGVSADHPRIVNAHDEFLRTDDGETIVDAAAGAAVVNLGHSLPGVGDVMGAQAESVGYISTAHFAHDSSERLAEQLAAIAPGDLNTSFFVNSGSEANETAIKLAHAYHRERGRPTKQKVIGRWQSYHGSTLGCLSVSGNTSRRVTYQPLLLESPHIPPAYPYRWRYTGTDEEQAISCARELETLIKQEGAESVAAFIAEPVSGSSIPAAHPHPAYYQEVRRICDAYDVLFIADEIMTGFGRTGELFAVNHFDVVPDMLSVGKGISGGYAPISATIVNDDIAAAFDHETGGSFMHGHTFSGNPISAAVGNHVVPRYTSELLGKANERGEQLRDSLDVLDDHPMVGEIRHLGLMLGIEFVADRDTKRPFDPDERINRRIADEAFERGVYVYPGSGSVDGVAGDHVMLSPPLTVSSESIDTIAAAVIESVDAVYGAVSA